jgi:hypothetical protein
LTIVFLVLNALMVAALFVPALFLAMASTGCMDSCNINVVEAGFNIAVFGPSVAFIVNLVLSIVFVIFALIPPFLKKTGTFADPSPDTH